MSPSFPYPLSLSCLPTIETGFFTQMSSRNGKHLAPSYLHVVCDYENEKSLFILYTQRLNTHWRLQLVLYLLFVVLFLMCFGSLFYGKVFIAFPYLSLNTSRHVYLKSLIYYHCLVSLQQVVQLKRRTLRLLSLFYQKTKSQRIFTV